jgi:hypothetical protein
MQRKDEDTNLACDAALQKNSTVLVDKFEVLQDLNSLLIVWDEIKILV